MEGPTVNTDNERGTADVFLLIVLLGGTLVPALFALGPPDWMNTAAGQIVLYGGAITVAVAGWRRARRGIAYVRRGWHILVSVHNDLQDLRAEVLGIKKFLGIEQHLGLEPLPQDASEG